MFHGVSAQETMASNLKDKGRAFRLAQSTLRHAEYLLSTQGSSMSHINDCNGLQKTPVICDNPADLQYPDAKIDMMILSNSSVYTTMDPAIRLSAHGGVGTYRANPEFHIQYLGRAANAQGQIYAVTALAYGGSANTVAAVQSTYKLTSGTRNLGAL